MPHKTGVLFLIVGSMLLLAACSQAPSEDAASGKGGAKTEQASGAGDTCKEYPVPIYPSRTELRCETGTDKPLRQTAYFASADPVEKVTAYYKTQVQSAGWTVDPMEVEGPTHSVVSMKKGKGYATAVINVGMDKVGSRTQIHAYPNGNG
jgi:hypothetical protein